MASRKGINIYITNYFMTDRNCMNIYVLYMLEVTPKIEGTSFAFRTSKQNPENMIKLMS